MAISGRSVLSSLVPIGPCLCKAFLFRVLFVMIFFASTATSSVASFSAIYSQGGGVYSPVHNGATFSSRSAVAACDWFALAVYNYTYEVSGRYIHYDSPPQVLYSSGSSGPASCVWWDRRFAWSINPLPFTPDASPYFCPLNSTQSGSTCACNTGYVQSATANSCVVKSEAVADKSKTQQEPQSCKASILVGKPINPLTGSETHPEVTGLLVAGVELRLTYSNAKYFTAQSMGVGARSLMGAPGFGAYWESNLHKGLKLTPGSFGAQLYRGNGSVVSFIYDATISAYVAPAGNADTLSYSAGQYLYKSPKGVETYDGNGKLLHVREASGTTLSYTYSNGASTVAPEAGYLLQITDNSGRSISFEYSLPAGGAAATDGLVSKATDTAGRSAVFAYDSTRNLSSITWSDNKTRNFVYENTSYPWALTGVIDERGLRYSTYGYDAQGRAISTELGGGVNKYSVTYSTPPVVSLSQVEDAAGVTIRSHEWVAPSGATLTLPNGQTATLDSTNVQGLNLLTSTSQPAGSGCAASTSSQAFDAKGNITSVDDFAGQRSCFAYDAKNQETVRVEGLANTVACASVLPANASLPTGSRKTTTSYHPDWAKPTEVNAPGSKTSTVYHGQSDPFNTNQVANCTTAPALPNGKPLPLVCKSVVRATLANGTIDTNVAAVTNTYSYDAQGRILSATDTLGRTTGYSYYASTAFTGAVPSETGVTLGDLQSITAPGGFVSTFNSYDRMGKVLKTTDPKGVVTDIAYTPRGWVSTVTTLAPGQTARTTNQYR